MIHEANNKPLTALLAHGYIEQYRKINKPDTNSRLVVMASAELIKQGRVNTVVFTTTCTEPPVAEQMALQLRRNLPNITQNNLSIIVEPQASITVEEVKVFKQLVQQSGWRPEDIGAIGTEVHLRRIKRAFRREFGRKQTRKIRIISSEEILTSDQAPKRYQKIIEAHRNSPEQKGLCLREVLFINPIDAIPVVGGKIIQYINKKLKGKKTLPLKVVNLLTKIEIKGRKVKK